WTASAPGPPPHRRGRREPGAEPGGREGQGEEVRGQGGRRRARERPGGLERRRQGGAGRGSAEGHGRDREVQPEVVELAAVGLPAGRRPRGFLGVLEEHEGQQGVGGAGAPEQGKPV
ncbi:hypothetical protein VTH06DRAFT_3644, partial [Thermothelomyces fergusii]